MTDTKKVLRPKHAADFLALSESTLAKMRMVPGAGPQFVKAGRTVLYLEEDLVSWLMENRRSATCDA